MDSKQLTESEQAFWDEAFRLSWKQCLREAGLRSAIYCVHLCREAADAALTERRNSERNGK